MNHSRNRIPRISLIAAVSTNGVIGRDGTLPWRLPADLKYFRQVTSGHTIVMGRKNYEDIGRPLPERNNIILSRRPGFSAPGCTVVHTLDDAIACARDDSEVFFIGGAEVYRQMLPRADRLYLTRVQASVKGDTYFPDFDENEWELIRSDPREADEANPYALSFDILERRSSSRG
jgi:dihydrofolate reductase